MAKNVFYATLSAPDGTMYAIKRDTFSEMQEVVYEKSSCILTSHVSSSLGGHHPFYENQWQYLVIDKETYEHLFAWDNSIL